MKKIFSLFIFMFILLIGSMAESLITKEDANIRVKPDKTSDIVQVIEKNTTFDGEISTENENWYKISYKGKEGYIHKSLVETKGINKEAITDIKHMILFVLCLLALVISMKVDFLNRLVTILLHLGRLIFVILCMKGTVFNEENGCFLAVVIFGCITAFLTLYGIGSSAFLDTRTETGNVLLNPLESGGYKVCSEMTGNSPAATFGLSIAFSLIVGFIVGFLLVLVAGNNETLMYIIVMILSIVGVIRGIASWIASH